MIKYLSVAGVAEWQTHQTQNLTGATSCRFESGCRHPWQGQEALESLNHERFQGFAFYRRSKNILLKALDPPPPILHPGGKSLCPTC